MSDREAMQAALDAMVAGKFVKAGEILLAALAQPDESFCDSHCTWRDHHPDCALRTEAAEEANRRANAGWALMCKKMVAAERDRCCRIIVDLCVSDNNAQEIVKKIRSGE
jgi:hypothetical protein